MKTLHKHLILTFAAFVILKSGTGVGSATIIYVPDLGFTLRAAGESELLDIGGIDPTLNFFVSQNASLNWNWEPTVVNFHQFVGDPMRASPIRFDTGVQIDDELFWTNNSRNVRLLASSGGMGTFYDTEGFLAVRVYEEQFGWENEDALPFYGWIRVSHSADDVALTVHDWAWNSTPGEPILAGQIPEPVAYAVMLAAGVLGFVIFRRRRRNGSA